MTDDLAVLLRTAMNDDRHVSDGSSGSPTLASLTPRGKESPLDSLDLFEPLEPLAIRFQRKTSEYDLSIDAESTLLHPPTEQLLRLSISDSNSVTDDDAGSTLLSENCDLAVSPVHSGHSVASNFRSVCDPAVLAAAQHNNKNNAASSAVVKRSYARQKQVKELLNTETVYIQSLEILSSTYLEGMMADIETPLYFIKFKEVIGNLIAVHKRFLAEVARIYVRWGKQASSGNSEMPSTYDSPDLGNYQLPFNEAPYLESIFALIASSAIDVPCYSVYCSIYSRVMEFAKDKDVEKYKRRSVKVVGEYVVQDRHEGKPDYVVQQSLDTRFISLVQMPTARLTRYALIVRSLMDKMRHDDLTGCVTRQGQRAIDTLTEKCLTINSYIGVAQERQNKLNLFRTVTKGAVENVMGPLFFENLGPVEFCGACSAVWMEDGAVVNECLGLFLFDTHLLLVKLGRFSPPEVRFIVPAAAIMNSFHSDDNLEVTQLYTHYPYTLKMRFEDASKKYEVLLAFASEYEKSMWAAKICQRVDRWRRGKGMHNGDFGFSEYVRNSACMMTDQIPFLFSCHVPEGLDHYSERASGAVFRTPHVVAFKHFATRINAEDQPAVLRAYETDRKQSGVVVVQVRKEQRTLLEKAMGSLWSIELPLFHTESGVLVRSISSLSLRQLISEERQTILNHWSASTPAVKSSPKPSPKPSSIKAGFSSPLATATPIVAPVEASSPVSMDLTEPCTSFAKQIRNVKSMVFSSSSTGVKKPHSVSFSKHSFALRPQRSFNKLRAMFAAGDSSKKH